MCASIYTWESHKRIDKSDKLISVSFANGTGAGFKVALEQPLAKYKTVKVEKPKGTTSKGGTALEKEPKEPKMKEIKPAKSEKLLWTSWREYPKETVNGVEHAKIGDRLYTEHVIGRMQPSALGRNANVTKE